MYQEKEIFNLNIFNNSPPILPLQEQYSREAKIVYAVKRKKNTKNMRKT